MLQSECITDNIKTVVFRKDKATSTILALFPLVPSAIKSGECYAFTCSDPYKVLSSVLYDTQKPASNQPSLWGSLDYEEAIAHTVPAIENEYRVLIDLISALGHELTIKTYEDLLPKKKYDLDFQSKGMLMSSSFSTMAR